MPPNHIPSSMDPPSAAELAEMLGYREGPPDPLAGGIEGVPRGSDWRGVISQRAYDFIVGWETGGRAYYEGVIKSRPVWPGFASGITIGCGYDLGYHTGAQFLNDWGGRIPDGAIQRLRPALGFRTVEPNRRAKVARAKALVRSLGDIRVPWDVAIRQFDEAKMPKLIAELQRGLSNLDRLHAHSRGALLSLVFNRGSGGFTSDKDRYREMAAIRRLMASGQRQDFERIPALLRAMTRLWAKDSSLGKRRRQEAELFEAGLAATGAADALVALASHGPGEIRGMPEGSGLPPQDAPGNPEGV